MQIYFDFIHGGSHPQRCLNPLRNILFEIKNFLVQKIFESDNVTQATKKYHNIKYEDFL